MGIPQVLTSVTLDYVISEIETDLIYYRGYPFPGSLAGLAGGYARLGCLWVSPNRWGYGTDDLHFWGVCDRTTGGDVCTHWELDLLTGSNPANPFGLEGTPYIHDYNGGNGGLPIDGNAWTPADTVFVADAGHALRDYLWRFGVNEQSQWGGPIKCDIALDQSATTGTHGGHSPLAIFDPTDYGLTDANEDFAIDEINDIVCVRETAMDVGHVKVFQLSSPYTLIADIYASNTTKGILMDGSGIIRIVDSYQWVHAYTYLGGYQGSFRAPRENNHVGGICHGWDPIHGRLLSLEATADSGADSTLLIKAWHPVPDMYDLTPAIPRSVPTKDTKCYFFANLTTEGGVRGIGSKVGVVNSVESVPLDGDGDLVTSVTPTATGAFAVALDVD